MYKIGINVILIICGGVCIFYLNRYKKNRVPPFSEIPINTSSDMILGCGFSFSGYFVRETYLPFEKMGFWVFSEGWDMFF